jgi:hypothetical protein
MREIGQLEIRNWSLVIGNWTETIKRKGKAERAAMDIRELYINVPGRDLPRGIEQALINEEGLGNLANQINSISPANQLGKYNDIQQRQRKKRMGTLGHHMDNLI